MGDAVVGFAVGYAVVGMAVGLAVGALVGLGQMGFVTPNESPLQIVVYA